MKRIIVDLNSDLGESFGAYKMGNDREVLQKISSANIACGFHASDPTVMHESVRTAKLCGVRVGAHPGFPDLMGFGRRNMSLTPDEVYKYTLYQIAALDGFCKAAGIRMQHVKPHGALYNMAAKDRALANAVTDAVKDYDKDLIMLVLYGGETHKSAREAGLRTCTEFFADRAYEEDGSLVDRRKAGAMIHDEDLAIRRVVRMLKEGKLQSITGKDIDIHADSVCVHGDGEKALAFTSRIRETLLLEGIEIACLEEVYRNKEADKQV